MLKLFKNFLHFICSLIIILVALYLGLLTFTSFIIIVLNSKLLSFTIFSLGMVFIASIFYSAVDNF